jgi:glycosyltransferase involved in cell wall biosynthesis
LKVSIYYSSFDIGGVERLILNLTRGLVNQGLDIEIVLAKAEGCLIEEIPSECRVVDFNFQWSRGGKRIVLSLPRLIKYFKKTPPDVLIAPPGWSTIVALLARRIAKSSTRILVMVDITLSTLQNSQKLHERLLPYLARWLYPQADGIVASYNKAANDLSQLTGIAREKIRVIYNTVVTPDIYDKANESIEHPWFSFGEIPVIIGVGRLVPEKDFPTLVRAFEIVKKAQPARLLILGEGVERSKLEALIRELHLEKDVDLLGYTSNPFVYMKHSSVLVLSSKREAFGNVLGEAMALGTPVISTNVLSGGPAEILEQGKYGQLVDVGNVNSLADAIVNTLNNPVSSDILRQKARDFSLDFASDAYLELIKKC